MQVMKDGTTGLPMKSEGRRNPSRRRRGKTLPPPAKDRDRASGPALLPLSLCGVFSPFLALGQDDLSETETGNGSTEVPPGIYLISTPKTGCHRKWL